MWKTHSLNELFKKQKRHERCVFGNKASWGWKIERPCVFRLQKRARRRAGQKKSCPDGSGKQLAQFGKVLASSAYWFKCKHINAKING